jgi:hypothetical protein
VRCGAKTASNGLRRDPIGRTGNFALPDDVLSLIQDYVPSAEARAKAVVLLQEILPDGEMCEAKVYDELRFIDPGANREAVLCPSCGGRFKIDYFSENEPVANVVARDIASRAGGWIRQGRANQYAVLRLDCSICLTRVRLACRICPFRLSIWNPKVRDGLLTGATRHA